jgi:hypothetical protein
MSPLVSVSLGSETITNQQPTQGVIKKEANEQTGHGPRLCCERDRSELLPEKARGILARA